MLQRMMTVEDFYEYVAYNKLEPFGEDREDMRAALVPHMLANYFSKKGKAPKYDDFLLSNMLGDEKQPKKRQSHKQMAATLKALFMSSQK